MDKPRIAILFFAGLLAAALTGCQQRSPRVIDVAAMRGETYTVNPPQAVFDPSSMHPGSAEASAHASGRASGTAAIADRRRVERWWVDRNNARLNVRDSAGYRSVTDFQVYIEDRQRSFNGEIDNHYRRTRRSVEYGTLVR